MAFWFNKGVIIHTVGTPATGVKMLVKTKISTVKVFLGGQDNGKCWKLKVARLWPNVLMLVKLAIDRRKFSLIQLPCGG